jgi:hypothetical protein
MAAGLIKFNTWLTKPNPFSIGTLISMYEDFIKHPLPPLPGNYHRSSFHLP